jgi:hypothetical protein
MLYFSTFSRLVSLELNRNLEIWLGSYSKISWTFHLVAGSERVKAVVW